MFKGWKLKELGNVEFYKCPNCGHCSEGLIIDERKTAKCYECNNRFEESKFKIISLKKPILVCRECGTKVSVTPEKQCFLGYLCPICQNYIAILFKKGILQPKTVMNLKWNYSIKNRAIMLEKNLFFTSCKTKKDFLILVIMQIIAKEEESGFRLIKENQKAGLLFNIKKTKICWVCCLV